MTQPTTRPTPQPQTRALPITPAEMAGNRDALAALLQEPPVPPPAKMTTTAAVAELAPEIRAALKAGHTLAEIAKRLRFGTRTLSAQQLQRYLARCEKRAVKKTASRKAAPPPADAAAPPTATSSSQASPSRDAQGTTAVTTRDAPSPQAPTVGQPTPPTAVAPAATTGGATAPVIAGASPGPTTTSEHHRPPAPTMASASTSAKPQSTASPELPGLSFEAARSRSIDRLFGPKKTEATEDRPRPPHMTWELNGHPKPLSEDGVKTEPPLGSTTRP